MRTNGDKWDDAIVEKGNIATSLVSSAHGVAFGLCKVMFDKRVFCELVDEDVRCK